MYDKTVQYTIIDSIVDILMPDEVASQSSISLSYLLVIHNVTEGLHMKENRVLYLIVKLLILLFIACTTAGTVRVLAPFRSQSTSY